MRISQIIFSVVALFAILGMFMLPKVVVSNEDKTLNTKATPKEETSPMPDAHQQKLPKEIQEELERLKNLLSLEENTQNSVTFADSIASLYKRVSQYDSAAHYSEYAVLKNPKDTKAIEKAADAYYEAFNFYGIISQEKAKKYGEVAKKYLEALLVENPKNHNAKTKLAITLVTSTNPMQGITMLKQIVEDDPNNELALLNLGLFSMQSGQYEKAVDRFKTLISANPNNGEAKIFLGQCYAEMGKTQDAKNIFEEIISQSTDSLLRVAAKEYLAQLK